MMNDSEVGSKPLVSVITNFLNAERFIEEAIESVFAQTYDNWELLLVDDGSTDGSTEIALLYAEQNPRKVRYLEHDGHQNRGMSASRNLGIRNARGEYIAFLDADDVYLPHKLGQQVTILESQPEAAMLYGSTQWWYSWSGVPQDIHRDHRDFVKDFGVQLDTLVRPPKLFTLFLQVGAAVPCPSNIMVRRGAIERIDGFEEAFRGMYEDQAFYAKVYLHEPVYVASDCWARYRQHSDSCSAVATRMRTGHSTRLSYLNWLADYLSKQEVSDAEVWQALHRSLWPYHHPLLYRLHPMYLVRQVKVLLKIAQQALKSIHRETA